MKINSTYELAEYIRQLRLNHGWSLRRLATAAGTRHKTVYLLEQCRRIPHASTAQRILAQLGATMSINGRSSISDALLYGRFASRLTQQALADVARVDRQTIHRLETGKCDPRLDTLLLILAALNLELQITHKDFS